MKKILLYSFTLAILMPSLAQKKTKKTTNAPTSSSIKNYEGFFGFYYDEIADEIILKVDKLDEEFLYVSALSAGVGSNDIGLDRGQLGGERVVKFIKRGQKLLLIQPNYRYRAISDNPEETKSVEEAFAQSVLWGFPIMKESNEVFEINVTSFLIRDVHDVIGTLQALNQGNYKLDKSRSAFNLSKTKNFPNNSDFDVMLTFTGKPKGNEIRSVTPDAQAVTVNEHHSFVQLPDDNYQPRVFDPRAGYYPISYMDYATPISEPIVKRFITRHRLEKKNPEADISEAVEPIIYYLDRGAPEPIRSALMEGASWWNEAFKEAGFRNAFQVKLLPEGVDPLDVRYNVIQWVHRSTRGWSYGGGVTDPRTGEIIKGHVSLGSLRVRQDFLIAEGLLAPYKQEGEVPKEMEEMALARLRQLSAHEVGHTIGLAHSYASSTEGRASVMDYPHPLVTLDNGDIVIKDAYDDKIGAWDKVAVNFGYRQFESPEEEKNGLEEIIQKSLDYGLTFLSDQDARPRGGAHAFAHLWDNGRLGHEELNRVMEIRKVAISNLGESSIRKGTPYASLEEVLVPIYFFHRYQVEAAVKIIGGLNYRYALKGDDQPVTEFVPADDQVKALKALLNTVSTNALLLPESLLRKIPPRPIGYYRSNELIKLRTEVTFDALGIAETAANMTFELLLHPARMNRLLEYKNRIDSQPGLELIMDELINTICKGTKKNGMEGEIQRTVSSVFLNNLLSLTSDKSTSTQVRAIIQLKIEQLKVWFSTKLRTEPTLANEAHYTYWVNQIKSFQKNPDSFIKEKQLTAPAGSPIGMDNYCEF